jgi:hypothetical protein
LGVWDQRRGQLWDDVAAGKAGVNRARLLARLRILLDRVTDLSQAFRQLSLDLADLERVARAGATVEPNKVAGLRRRFAEAKGQMDGLMADVGREADGGLRQAWTDLGRQVRDDDERLTQLEQARTAEQRTRLKVDLERKADLAERTKESFQQISTRLREAEAGAERVTAQLKRDVLLDPQLKYDQANRQAKQVYEKRPAPKQPPGRQPEGQQP